MRIDDFRRNLEKRAQERGLRFSLGEAATDEALVDLARRVGAQVPRQVELFYRAHDGLLVHEPPLTVLPVEQLRVERGHYVVFAVVDGRHPLAFDVSHRNEAEQWDIVHLETGHRVTLTMASFWSNKVFAWLDKRRSIWATEPDPHAPPAGHPDPGPG